MSVAIYEHATYGEAEVTFGWRDVWGGLAWVPISVEFDLFCPMKIQEELTTELRSVRLDRLGSVSASVTDDGGYRLCDGKKGPRRGSIEQELPW